MTVQDVHQLESMLTPEELAGQLRVSTSFLSLARYKGGSAGPPFVKIGKRVFYRPSDVSVWLDSRTATQTGQVA